MNLNKVKSDKSISNLDRVQEIIECLDMLYCDINPSGMCRLPKELSRFSGPIGIAYTNAIELKSSLEEEG